MQRPPLGPMAPGEPRRDEGPVGPRRAGGGGPKLGEDRRRILPGAGDLSHEGAMAGPGGAVQGAGIREDLGPHGIQMEIPDQLQEVRRFLHDDGRVAVLEQVADPLVAAIERAGVAREEAAHAAGEGLAPGPHEEMHVRGEKGQA